MTWISTVRVIRMVLLVGTLAVAGCGGGGDGDSDGGGEGDGGGMDGGGTVDSGPGTGTEGAPCTRTAQCVEGLYCSDARVCEPAGSGGEDELCDTTADCQRGLVCAPSGGGTDTCQPAGSGGEGDTCVEDTDCQAGLYCNDEAECTATPPGGGGDDGGSPDADLGDAGLTCDAAGDCDDGDACTIDQCVADMCDNTLGDIDEDGYADSQLGSECGDCNDNDDTVNPDHEEFEPEMHDGNPTTGPSWDWNCDGTLEKRWPSTVVCSDAPCDGEGWLGTVPECGESGTYVRCVDGVGGTCTTETIEAGRIQTCR